jgi:hypothetical protein
MPITVIAAIRPSYHYIACTIDLQWKMKDYGIASVPTTVTDKSIKVVGIPDFPWICGDDMYKKLKNE